MKKDTPMRLGDELDDDGEETVAEPWALGDLDLEPFELGGEDDGFGEADGWLDEQLGGLRAESSQSKGPTELAEAAAPFATTSAGGGGDVVLRRSASTRSPRRRRADPDAMADLPPAVVPGYVRDRRGTWRYGATGRAVPGARDLTLRSLYRFPVTRSSVLVPVDMVRSARELAWCMGWKHTLTTALQEGRSETVLRVPVGEWERRADIPIGLWAPELTATRLLSIADVARLVGVSPATITAYLSRRRMPEPVMRLGNTPLWSEPVIRQWLSARPGQGKRNAVRGTPQSAHRT